jgi:predicted methyltransferase
VLLAACAGVTTQPISNDEVHAIIAAPDRTDADRVVDKRRDPVKLLAFYGVARGMKVLDLSAGGGYNAELLARAVGPGAVYAQNSPDFMVRLKDRWAERMKNPAMKNVISVVREFDDPLPPEVKDLDLVTFNFNYHDLGYMNVDRAKMNHALFNALKPGGTLIIADHSGRPGTGISEAKSLHRVEESLVRREVESAGFKFIAEGGFLRNPNDPRDKPVFKPTQPNDEFVLKFVRP